MYASEVLGEERFWNAISIDYQSLQATEEYRLNEYVFSISLSQTYIHIYTYSLFLRTVRRFCVNQRIPFSLQWSLDTTILQKFGLEKTQFKCE